MISDIGVSSSSSAKNAGAGGDHGKKVTSGDP